MGRRPTDHSPLDSNEDGVSVLSWSKRLAGLEDLPSRASELHAVPCSLRAVGSEYSGRLRRQRISGSLVSSAMKSAAKLDRRGFLRTLSGRRDSAPVIGPGSETLGKLPLARVSIDDCLAYRGSFCTVCSEHCPEEGAIQMEQGRPHISAASCNGCGVCQQACPAPRNAILLLPKTVGALQSQPARSSPRKAWAR